MLPSDETAHSNKLEFSFTLCGLGPGFNPFYIPGFLWWAALLCSILKKMTKVQCWTSSKRHPWPFGSVWSWDKHEMWQDCWSSGSALTRGLHKFWIFELRKGSCQIKRTYFLVVQKTWLQIRWVHLGWWLHACSQCWRMVKNKVSELSDTSPSPVNLHWPLTQLVHLHSHLHRL